MAPDGADFHSAGTPARLSRTRLALTADGRALLLFEGLPVAPPEHGRFEDELGGLDWTAHAWMVEGSEGVSWSGFALLDRPPLAGGELGTEAGNWRIAAPAAAEVGPAPLAALAARGGADMPALLAALTRGLVERAATPEARQAGITFARGFLARAAERDGFVELLGHPDGGGLFAQGWSLSLAQGEAPLLGLGAELGTRMAEIAHFPREDVMAPATGVCLFARLTAPGETQNLDALFFAQGRRLLRLDLVPEAPRFDGPAGVAHLAGMQPRLAAPEPVLRAFRRVHRPRFPGRDTLSETPLPVAMGLDLAIRSPGGEILLQGWLLDPLARVERVLLKSTANLYARIDASWCALPRRDLHAAFGADPRFAGLFDPNDAQHGFVAHVSAGAARLEGALYLELVLDDGGCLFRPVEAVAIATPDPALRALSTLSPREPELPRIIETHFAPFLADFPRAAPSRGAKTRPIPLGAAETAPRAITALVPYQSFGELQPMLALLADTPDAARLELVLIASREIAAETLPRLEPAFAFHGLSGALVIAKDGASRAARLDAGLAEARSPRILVWLPSALPTRPGWADALIAEARALPGQPLLAPRLIYEDGSIHFGATPDEAPGAGDGWAGYRACRLRPGPPRPVAAGAPDVALIERAALAEAGGFSGRLFGDESAHLDLAHRLAEAGHVSFCSGSVAFWKLEDPTPAAEDPRAALIARLDAALLARRGPALKGIAR